MPAPGSVWTARICEDAGVNGLLEQVAELLRHIGRVWFSRPGGLRESVDRNGAGPGLVPSPCEIADAELGFHFPLCALEDLGRDIARILGVLLPTLDPVLADDQLVDLVRQIADPKTPRSQHGPSRSTAGDTPRPGSGFCPEDNQRWIEAPGL